MQKVLAQYLRLTQNIRAIPHNPCNMTPDTSPLRTLRHRLKLSLDTVANHVSTNTGNLSRIENGKQRASPELAERLAKYFGYAINEIQILYPERFTGKP